LRRDERLDLHLQLLPRHAAVWESDVTITYKINPPVTSAELNTLFSAGRDEPEMSDWTAVLKCSLVIVSAYEGTTLVGFVHIAWDGRDHAFVLDPRVHPDWRHQGIGTELVRRSAEAAKGAGCETLHVDFRDDLAPFYFEACGFRSTKAGLIWLK
jgi:ribosomal protein S18 acetylase RimI-like enzyme